MKLHDYFPRDWWPSTSSADAADRPGSAPLPPQPAELDTGPGRPSHDPETLFGEHGLFAGPVYRGTPIREVENLEEELRQASGADAVRIRRIALDETPVGEAWGGFRASGDAEHQDELNRRATAAVGLVNQRRVEREARLCEQRRAVAESVVQQQHAMQNMFQMHEGVAHVGLQRLPNCSPGRHEMFVLRTRRSLRRERYEAMVVGVLMGATASVGAFVVMWLLG